jgi:hypothetical protein
MDPFSSSRPHCGGAGGVKQEALMLAGHRRSSKIIFSDETLSYN